jgi:hypothetical protein
VTDPPIKLDSQVWQTPVRQDHFTGTSQASANSSKLWNLEFHGTVRPLRVNETLGLGQERPRFDIRLKEPKLPLRDVALITAVVTAFDVLPHAEEYVRCLRAERRGLRGTSTPPCAPVLFGGSSPKV